MVAPKLILLNINTRAIPLLDLDLQGWYLSPLTENAFDYDMVDLEDLDPDSEYYDEVASLVEDHYDGIEGLKDQILLAAPDYLAAALAECDIAAAVVPDSIHWNVGILSRNDYLSFDLDVDPIWAANKFLDLLKNQNFRDSVDVHFYNPIDYANVPATFDRVISSPKLNWWTNMVLWYIVTEYQGALDEISENLFDDIYENPRYRTFSDYNIW